MTTALAIFNKHRNVFLIDVVLLTALLVIPGLSHLTAFPLYMFEPMRVALLVALLFTNRTNTYFIAFVIPLVSVMVTGHPAPFKALLIGIELSVLVATYSYFIRLERMPAFLALTIAILFGKVIYYMMKFAAINAGLLTGGLISTPLPSQLALVVGTAAVFGLVEYYRTRNHKR